MRKNVLTIALLAMTIVLVLTACGPAATTVAPATSVPPTSGYLPTAGTCNRTACPHRNTGTLYFRHAAGGSQE